MKKLWAFVLALALLGSLAANIGVAEGATYTTTLRVSVFDRGNMTEEYGTVDNNRWTRWAQENFGDPNGIKLEYVAIPRSEEVAKLNTLMAAGTAPDIVFTYSDSVYYNYAMQGGLKDITSLVEEYGANLQANIDMNYGVYQGKRYAIYARRIALDITGNYIRKDWLDAIDYELEVDEEGYYHISVDDLTDCLYKFKEADVDGTGLEVFPLGMNGSQNVSRSTRGILEYFYDRAAIDEKTQACEPDLTWEGGYEAVEWMNKLYNDRIIDPDFIVDTTVKTMDQYIITGRVGFWSDDSWHGVNAASGDVIEQLYDANPKAEVVAIQVDNVHGEQMQNIYAATGIIMMVPATSSDDAAKAAVMYMNWLADYDVDQVFRYGMEGEHYAIVDGIPKNIDDEYVQKTKISTGDIGLLFNGDPIYGGKMTVAALPARVQSIRATTMVLALRGGYAPYPWGQPIESENQYGTNLGAKRGELFAACIMCAPDALEATFAQYMDSYLSSGGQEIIDEKNALYDELNG